MTNHPIEFPFLSSICLLVVTFAVWILWLNHTPLGPLSSSLDGQGCGLAVQGYFIECGSAHAFSSTTILSLEEEHPSSHFLGFVHDYLCKLHVKIKSSPTFCTYIPRTQHIHVTTRQVAIHVAFKFYALFVWQDGMTGRLASQLTFWVSEAGNCTRHGVDIKVYYLLEKKDD